MEVFFETFNDYLKVEKGLSSNTLDAYSRDLRKYEYYLKSLGINDPKKVVRKNITDFLFYLRKDISPVSIARYLSTLKSFHKFLLREKITSIDPSDLIETP
ncbi:MAG: site-specific integrase, partial [Candidatus Omnitrophica bacterium]|nr:site-specific integrase [Candidatus Omnitrophota bacterium]